MKTGFAIFGLILLVSSAAMADTPLDRILEDLEAGEISSVQAYDLLTQSAMDYDQLPARYTDGVDQATCGTPAIMEALKIAEAMGFAPLSANRPPLSGPEYTFNSPDGHFKIHWTDSGADATNITYANSVAAAADSSWAVEVTEMGWTAPPPDYGVGGDDLYDIYLCYLTGGTLGYTSPSGEYHPPDSSQDCSASHIVIGTGIAQGTRVCTVAHEFQHACQMSMDYHERTWWMENCAVWMEEMVYPDVDDYQAYIHYGENPIRTPWMDVRSGSMYWYGAFTWPWMMWNRWGYESVRSVWEYCYAVNGQNTEDAHASMFADHGTDWKTFYMDYCCWRWFTADNWFSGCGMYNSEVQQWTPGPRVLPWHEITSLPATGDQTSYYPPCANGNHWVRVDLTAMPSVESIAFHFDGRDDFDWGIGIIMQDYGNSFTYEWEHADPTSGEISIVKSTTGYDYAIMVVGGLEDSPSDHDYEFTIQDYTGIEGSTPDVSGHLDLQVASNPIQSGDLVTFNMPSAGNALINVYDMSGRVSAVLLDDDLQAGEHSVQFQADGLSQGTYFVMIFADDQIEGRKVVLTR